MKIRSKSIVATAALFASFPAGADSFGPGFTGYVISPVFQNVTIPNQLPPIPVSYGGIAFNPTNPGEFVIGGLAGGTGARFFRLPFQRGAGGHIVSSPGNAVFFANAPKLSSGIAFAPGNVLLYTIDSGSAGVDVGMIKPGSTSVNKSVGIITGTPGSLNFVPAGFGGAGQLKLLAGDGRFYTISLTPDGDGTFTLSNPVLEARLPQVNVEGFVYIKGGQPGFPRDSMLVAERILSDIVVFDVDGNGNPIPSTRRLFYWFYPQRAVEGLLVDPQTNDILLTTRNGSTSAIYRFESGPPNLIRSCGEIIAAGSYVLERDLVGCSTEVRADNVSLNCNGHTGRVSVNKVRHFTVVNCTWVNVSGSSHGSVTGNKGFFYSNGMTDTLIADNEWIGSSQNYLALRNTFRANRIKCSSGYCGDGAFYLTGSSQNVLDSNEIDGNREPSATTDAVGARAVVRLRDSANNTLRNNIIKNGWWGVEFIGASQPNTLTNNTITNVRVDQCGTGTATPVCPVP